MRTPARTERLTIEALAPEHAPGLLAALADERVGRFIGGPDVTTLDALVARIERVRQGPGRPGERWLNFVALVDGEVIGRVEATIHDDIAEVAYVFGPRWWGHGFATEATAWMIDELAIGGITECWATVDPGNFASVRLLGRLGFVQVEPCPGLMSYDPGDVVFVRR